VDRGVTIADTDVLIDLLEQEGAHAQAVRLLRSGRLGTTAVNVFELWKGLETDEEREVARRALRGLRVYPLGEVAAKRAAAVRHQLRASPIGERDTLVAGICLSIGRPVLTRNARHLRRVPGLQVVAARSGPP